MFGLCLIFARNINCEDLSLWGARREPQYPQITQPCLQSRTITWTTHLRVKLTNISALTTIQKSSGETLRSQVPQCIWEFGGEKWGHSNGIWKEYIFFWEWFSISLCPLELSLHYWLFHNPVIIESEKPAALQTMAGTAVNTEVSGLISFHQSLASDAESSV